MKNFSDWLQIKKTTLPAVLAFGGEEKAFIDEAVADVKKLTLSPGMEDFNLEVLNGKSSSLDSIISSANVFPIMSKQRLVVVKESENLPADDLVLLTDYLKSPSITTVLIFIFDNLDARQKMVKILNQEKICFKFEHPKDDEMLILIKRRAVFYELQCSDESAWALLMEIGSDLLLLERALEKLSLSCKQGVIALEDIGLQISETRTIDAFVLAKAVAIGDRVQAISCLAKLKMSQEVPLRLVGMLAWQLRQILKAKIAIEEGCNSYELSKKLGVFGDRLQPVLKAAKQRTVKSHISRLCKLRGLDKSLKSSKASPWLCLERVVLQLCPINKNYGGSKL
ncbi:MAG: DNA polymerase III subunit delta [bacterium]|nr:DNA polymerase III subunit delta [bacterium]